MIKVDFSSPVTLTIVLLSCALHVANTWAPAYQISLTYFGAYVSQFPLPAALSGSNYEC